MSDTSSDTSSDEVARVAVVGNGGAAAHLARGLGEALGTAAEVRELAVGAWVAAQEARRAQGTDPGGGPFAFLHGAALALCAVEGASYRTLLALQERLLAAGVPGLFITADPDGVRLGPTAVPGRSPCLACAQLASLRFLGLPAPETLAAAGKLTAGPLPPPLSPALVRAAAAEVMEILDPAGEPRLLTGMLLFPTSLPGPGGARLHPIPRDIACPLCGDAAPPPARTPRAAADLAARADRQLLAATEAGPRRVAADEGAVASVGILGGGTAGYLAALALRSRLPHLRVTLLESSAVPIIGVGEATTPLMPQFLHADLGLPAGELFRRVRPTLKLGIRFLWGAAGDGDFNYPFGPVRVLEPYAYEGHIRGCSLRSLLMAAEAVPVERSGAGSWRSRLGTEVAYHLDNEPFVAYLREKAIQRGVERTECTIADVELSEDGGEVRALLADDGRRFSFDLYLDCSGFRSLLMEGALGSPFISYAGNLFTDRAVVAAVPHGGTVRPYTLAETLSAGWCWSTPQAEEDHRGYVYSSAFLDDDAAEAEMHRTNPGMGEARIVRFRAGRHDHFWKGNVVALGNAYGFVEPLESTALHMLIRQIGLLLAAFPLRRGDLGVQPLLNRKVNGFWDYLEWFLALHYKHNRRLDTPFWQECRRRVDVSRHGELLESFRHRGPLSYDRAARSTFDYPDPLWGAEGVDVILLGQEVPCHLPRPALGREAWLRHQQRTRAVAARALPHARALQAFARHPELPQALEAAFRAAGPAFPTPPHSPSQQPSTIP